MVALPTWNSKLARYFDRNCRSDIERHFDHWLNNRGIPYAHLSSMLHIEYSYITIRITTS